MLKDMIKNVWRKVVNDDVEQSKSFEEFKKVLNAEKDITIEDKTNIEDMPIPETITEIAQINSIKLRYIDDENSYFEVELTDEEGKSLGVFGSPYLTDPVNFRKEVFGLLEACGTNNFLKLGGKEDISIPITYRCNNRGCVEEIRNGNNQIFHLNEAGKYATEPAKENNSISYEEGTIASIESASNTLSMCIMGMPFSTYYVSGNVYYGFGYPLYSSTNNPELIQKASKHYKEYIENMLKFFGTDDLLRIGGEPSNLPKVLIQKDETGNIIAIGNSDKEYYLSLSGDNYEIKEGKLKLADNKSKKLI